MAIAPLPLAPPQQTFERGDRIYLVAPVQRFTPTDQQVEEFAFHTQVKRAAPNENIVWFRGQYVEADNPNANGAMWRSEELAIKSLTPMLMPVTVMHDPRTAVGTIADVRMLTPDADGVPRARIDTVLALWGHRFPEAVQEAEINAEQGTLMQSMECYSPWYECSICGSIYHKLPGGAEQAQWCAHLRASNPSAGYVDLSQAQSVSQAQSANASRILGDVCFTGTGLIFGTRGARGAYSEAHLNSFQDELAAHHTQVHTSTATTRSASSMGQLVQIDSDELATLRKERDDAKAEAVTTRQTLMAEKAAAESAAEQAEAAKVAAEAAKVEAERQLQAANEAAAKVELKEKRWGSLGGDFIAKLGDFTKGRLQEQAGTMEDAEWENRLKELEEITAVKRDAKKESGPASETANTLLGDLPPDFKPEEIAAASGVSRTGGPAIPPRDEQAQVIGKLGSLFAKA